MLYVEAGYTVGAGAIHVCRTFQRENSLVATENYNNSFIGIGKMIFPSLPLIYVFVSLAAIPSFSCLTTFGGALLLCPAPS
jgi:hypothetical protein